MFREPFFLCWTMFSFYPPLQNFLQFVVSEVFRRFSECFPKMKLTLPNDNLAPTFPKFRKISEYCRKLQRSYIDYSFVSNSKSLLSWSKKSNCLYFFSDLWRARQITSVTFRAFLIGRENCNASWARFPAVLWARVPHPTPVVGRIHDRTPITATMEIEPSLTHPS